MNNVGLYKVWGHDWFCLYRRQTHNYFTFQVISTAPLLINIDHSLGVVVYKKIIKYNYYI